ncbi:hypothetical protein H0E87_031069 [Populus deltoides]|uniref:Uncharacterized protein n=1 Tax=Populus deltoides TaxID=3696 RepID=A0A8T2WJS2_POPDE|nr:hypothetical protein H0E87_031069 [Populus deltoides]
MEGFQPSFMEEVDNMTWNQLGFQSEEDTFNMSELLSYVILKHILSEDDCLQFSYSSVYPIIPKKQYNVVTVHGSRPPPEVPVNQSSISCNDQGGQNNLINDSIQQTTQFPTSFPETMMERFPPSSMDDLESLFLSPAPEVPVNQGSILCNDQGGHKNVINDSIQQTTQFPTSFPETMTGHGYMTPNATTSQHGEFNQPGPSSLAPCEFIMFEYRYQPNPNLFDPQCANPLRDQQLTYYQLPMSNQVPAMLPGPHPPMNQWIQHFPNQGQVDQAFAIPNIDNMQQENFVPQNFDNSTRSQMDNLQVRGLQNQTATPNASNPGHGTSLQSQNRGLNTQQQNKGNNTEVVVSHPSGYGGIGRVQREVQVVEPGVVEERISSHAIAGNDVVSMTGMRAQEDRVSEGVLESRLRTEPVDRSLEQSNAVLGNMAGGARRIQETCWASDLASTLLSGTVKIPLLQMVAQFDLNAYTVFRFTLYGFLLVATQNPEVILLNV